METIEDVSAEMMKNCPGLIGMLVIDSDGIPVTLAGEFDMPAEHLGAMLASCFQMYQKLGEGMGQFYVKSNITEYDEIKVVQHMMPRGSLVLVAQTSAPLGLIRMEAKWCIQELNKLMAETAMQRERLMEQHKFRRPQSASAGGGSPISLLAYLERKG